MLRINALKMQILVEKINDVMVTHNNSTVRQCTPGKVVLVRSGSPWNVWVSRVFIHDVSQ